MTGRIRTTLDFLTTLLLVTAAGFVIHQNYPAGRSKKTVTIPDEPVSLESAGMIGELPARIGLLVYTDFQCPFCKRFAEEVIPSLKARYINNGSLVIAVRHFPLEKIHPLAFRSAEAAVCSSGQRKFVQFHDMLFAKKPPLNETVLHEVAEAAGLDLKAFERCLTGQAKKVVETDLASGRRLGIGGTPALLFGQMLDDGRLAIRRASVGAMSLPEVEEVLDDLLAPGIQAGSILLAAVAAGAGLALAVLVRRRSHIAGRRPRTSSADIGA